eukprot:5934536-Prymnesium_polylepis.1
MRPPAAILKHCRLVLVPPRVRICGAGVGVGAREAEDRPPKCGGEHCRGLDRPLEDENRTEDAESGESTVEVGPCRALVRFRRFTAQRPSDQIFGGEMQPLAEGEVVMRGQREAVAEARRGPEHWLVEVPSVCGEQPVERPAERDHPNDRRAER